MRHPIPKKQMACWIDAELVDAWRAWLRAQNLSQIDWLQARMREALASNGTDHDPSQP